MASGFEVVVAGGTRPVGKDAVGWAKTCQDLGAGVILPTSMDGDGTLEGYDLEFTRAILYRLMGDDVLKVEHSPSLQSTGNTTGQRT